MQTRYETEKFEKAVKERTLRLQRAIETTIQDIAAMVEVRDPYTVGHQKRVGDMAMVIASQMGLPALRLEGIKMAGIVHNLGMIHIPVEMFSKEGKLTEIEFEIIKTHPQVGYDLLKHIEFPWPIAQMVLQHHEMIDGSGYPQGLKGEEIMLEARILAVADLVDAMSSPRPHRPVLGIEKILGEINKNKGRLYDPEVVDAYLKIFEQGYKPPEV
ncbi:MAG: HD-GYP domain-containing protein [Chloroflexota bacterium]